eukprot:TRINITY_DN15399_c0_g1_i1.p2 TRINITY_DN15399_c0_g1~~TRINITY_DN15399_c0_g1_i1.p2  ORF type:complete len:286 (+),score=64.39 TRINITY_DN15399_c0_g1_i1:73-858(+)
MGDRRGRAPGSGGGTELVSAVTNSGIRYEGTLQRVDPNADTVTLTDVTVFGTEGRVTGPRAVPAEDAVYQYMVLRGSDIRELTVFEEKGDPAVLKVGKRQAGPPHADSRDSWAERRQGGKGGARRAAPAEGGEWGGQDWDEDSAWQDRSGGDWGGPRRHSDWDEDWEEGDWAGPPRRSPRREGYTDRYASGRAHPRKAPAAGRGGGGAERAGRGRRPAPPPQSHPQPPAYGGYAGDFWETAAPAVQGKPRMRPAGGGKGRR